jgi:hypothetical protein
MSSIKKLPPNVARELLRHVSPAGSRKVAMPSAAADLKKNGAGASSSGHYVLIGCLAFTAAAASLPVLATWWIGRLSDREDPLTAAQVRRGAFMNSGGRDVGVDRNWDFATGSYKQPTGYAVMVAEEKGQGEMKLRGDFLAMDEAELQKHEDKLEAFAKGRGGRGSSSSSSSSSS